MAKTQKKTAIATSNPAKIKKAKAAQKSASSVAFSPGDSKQNRMIALLKRQEGAAIEELMTATGWQRHSIRGAISGALKKRMGLTVTSVLEARGRVYRITGDCK